MNIYVDFDDCLCETARAFSDIALEMFNIDVPYEKMRYFNLQMAFGLDDEQYDALLRKGHEPEVLLGFDETPGAVAVLNEWIEKGNNVSIITGRPFGSFEPSREWLDEHGLKNPGDAMAIARHEVLCSFDDVARSAAALLKPGGSFFLVHRPFRLAEIFETLKKYKLEPKCMQLVYPFADKEPNMVLIESTRGGRSGMKVLKPLIIYKQPGVYTDDIYDIYGY